jgi:CRISPR-associated protein Cas2
MRMLIAYDVATLTPAGARRLRRVAQACEDYGQRVQKSVFECQIGPTQWAELRVRLLAEIDAKEDSIRVYHLDEDTRVEHHGAGEPADLDGPLIV